MSVKTWFVTGASSGFGRAYAAHALARGYNVVATARTLSTLDDVVARAPAVIVRQRVVQRQGLLGGLRARLQARRGVLAGPSVSASTVIVR